MDIFFLARPATRSNYVISGTEELQVKSNFVSKRLKTAESISVIDSYYNVDAVSNLLVHLLVHLLATCKSFFIWLIAEDFLRTQLSVYLLLKLLISLIPYDSPYNLSLLLCFSQFKDEYC